MSEPVLLVQSVETTGPCFSTLGTLNRAVVNVSA